jgi:phage N-6-adenine-methyltransferase
MSDEWYSPKSLFDDLNLHFDLDVASAIDNKSHVPATRRYTIEDDGLVQTWEGRVWMNPPYSKPSPWVTKWLEHCNGIALLPMAKSRWFNELMQSEAKFVLLPSTFKFDSPEGKPLSLMMGSTLWALGDDNVEAISRLGKVR